jgi:hypothetical protein
LPSLRAVWVGLSAGSMVMTPSIGEDFVFRRPPTGCNRALGIVDFRSFRTWIMRDGQQLFPLLTRTDEQVHTLLDNYDAHSGSAQGTFNPKVAGSNPAPAISP